MWPLILSQSLGFFGTILEIPSVFTDFMFNKPLFSPLIFPFMWYHLWAHKHALALSYKEKSTLTMYAILNAHPIFFCSFVHQTSQNIEYTHCLHYFTSFLSLLQSGFCPHYWNKNFLASSQEYKTTKYKWSLVSSFFLISLCSIQPSYSHFSFPERFSLDLCDMRN